MQCCFTVDDVCYEGYSSEEHLRRLLAFLREHKVPATFFVVPLAQGIPLGERAGYVELLKQALAEGHEIGQHGLEHDRFELGIPPQMVLDLPHETANRERVARERETILAGLSVAVLRGRLKEGRDLLEDALGIPMRAFRAPALSVCENLFVALVEEGYAVDSSCYFQPAGWDLLVGKTDVQPKPIDREWFLACQRPPYMKELVLTADYTWYLPPKRYDSTLALARHDFDGCLAARVPFVPICHVSPIFEGEDDLGLQLYRELFETIRERGRAENEPIVWRTLSAAAENLE